MGLIPAVGSSHHSRKKDTHSMPLNPTLRLIHTSDWHLGHELFGHSREAEHDAFLNWLVEQLEAEQADALVVAGDIYDVAHPPVAAMARLYRFLREATDRCSHLQIVMIGGNHDSAARINLPAPLLDQKRVLLVGALPRSNDGPAFQRLCVPLCNRDGQTAAWAVAVPYCRPGDLGARSLTQLFAEAIQHAEVRAAGLPLIAYGHLHVAGGEISEHSERRITIGGGGRRRPPPCSMPGWPMRRWATCTARSRSKARR